MSRVDEHVVYSPYDAIQCRFDDLCMGQRTSRAWVTRARPSDPNNVDHSSRQFWCCCVLECTLVTTMVSAERRDQVLGRGSVCRGRNMCSGGHMCSPPTTRASDATKARPTLVLRVLGARAWDPSRRDGQGPPISNEEKCRFGEATEEGVYM